MCPQEPSLKLGLLYYIRVLSVLNGGFQNRHHLILATFLILQLIKPFLWLIVFPLLVASQCWHGNR